MRILKIVAHVLPRERDVNANGKGGWFSWFFQRRRKAGLEGRSLRETRRVARLFCDETSRKNRRLRGKRWESARESSAKMRQVAWIVAFSNPFKSRMWSCREYKWRARNSLVRLLGENGNFGLALIPNHHLITVRFTSVASPVFNIILICFREGKSLCNTSRSNHPFTNRSNVHVHATNVPLMRRSIALQRSTEGYGCNYRTPFRRISICPMHRFK